VALQSLVLFWRDEGSTVITALVRGTGTPQYGVRSTVSHPPHRSHDLKHCYLRYLPTLGTIGCPSFLSFPSISFSNPPPLSPPSPPPLYLASAADSHLIFSMGVHSKRTSYIDTSPPPRQWPPGGPAERHRPLSWYSIVPRYCTS